MIAAAQTCVPPLGQLARAGDVDGLISALDAGLRPTVASSCGWSPLCDAAWAGHLECVRHLISASPDVDAPTADGLTPLMIAAARGHTDVVRLLCAHGARVDRRSRDGRTAVESALQNGHVGVAALLHVEGATFDGPVYTLYLRALAQTQGRRCALVDPGQAMARGDSRWLWVLDGPLQVDADLLSPVVAALQMPPQLTHAGTTALTRIRLRQPVEFSVQPDHPALATPTPLPSRGWRYRCGWTEHVQSVLHGESGPDTPDQFGYIPLLEAIRGGRAEVVRALLDAGADPRQVPHYGCMRGATMLINAAEQGSAEVVSALVDAGAPLDTETATGWTALMVAASRGHEDCVRRLIQAGADLSTRNAQGQTALALAQRRRFPNVARLLLVARNVDRADLRVSRA